MGLIQNLLEKHKRRKEMLEQYENEDRITHKIQERKKSSNERELERYLEEERQEKIKKALTFHRKMRNNEYWRGSTMLNSNKKMIKDKNMFKDNKSFLVHKKSSKNKNRMFSW